LRVQSVGVRNAPPRAYDSRRVDEFDVVVLPVDLQVFTVYDLDVPDLTPDGRGTLFMYLGIYLWRLVRDGASLASSNPDQAGDELPPPVPLYYFVEWPLCGRKMVERFTYGLLPRIYKKADSTSEYKMLATPRSIGSPDFYTEIVSQHNMLSGQYYYIATKPRAQALAASGIYRYIATFRDCREDAPGDKHVVYRCSNLQVYDLGEYAIECVWARRSYGPPPTSWLPLNYQRWP